MTVNNLINGEGKLGVNLSLSSLDAKPVSGSEKYLESVNKKLISLDNYTVLKSAVKAIDITPRFKDVINTFKTPSGETPAGFRIESTLEADGLLLIDLVRDIMYDKNGEKRPTSMTFSADSANPYEVEPIAGLLGNLTCNPGIVYDLFINNPKANVGNKYKTRDEVMIELGRILGPGCDISVELNNPFEEDFSKVLEECETFKEILSEYRLVVKVPHTGPVNSANLNELLTGDKKFSKRYDEASTADALRGHNLALKLREHGYRINYTLMFEPYQSALALQAKPYFINSFVRHRMKHSEAMQKSLKFFAATEDSSFLKDIRSFMISNDYLHKNEADKDLLEVKKLAEDILKYRDFEGEGSDGLDGVRHNLNLLRNCNLNDTKLIICSMEGPNNYPDIDRFFSDPRFEKDLDRLIITAEPSYLARFTSTSQVVSYQRRFLNAANGQK